MPQVTPAAFDVNGQDPEAEGDASRVAAAENGAAAREPSQLMHTSRILQWEGFQALLSNILYQQVCRLHGLHSRPDLCKQKRDLPDRAFLVPCDATARLATRLRGIDPLFRAAILFQGASFAS